MNLPSVVIGAGVAGMTTALLLAKRGERVVLVEAAPRCAPLIRGFSRDGVAFDTGFHYAGGLGEGEPLDRFLRHLGVRDSLEVIPCAAAYDRCRIDAGFEFAFPQGEAALQTALTQVFPAGRDSVARYLARVREAWNAFPFMNLEAPLDAVGAFDTLDGPSLATVLAEHDLAPELRALLELHCLLHGVDPDEIPFALHACVAGPYYRSAHGIVGGGAALATAFEAQLGRAGVEVRLGVAASAIDCSDAGAVRAVRLADGSAIPCRSCVATLHPRLLPGLLPAGALRPAYRKRLERLEESAGALVLYVRTRRPMPELQGCNLFLLESAADCARLTGGVPAQRPLYLAGAAAGSAGFLLICPLALTEVATWQGSHGGARPESYRRFKDDLVAALRRRLQRQAPELEAEIVSVAAATPLTYRDYVLSPEGSLYGVKHRVGQLNPQPQTRVAGLWLAGQAVAAPGVLGAMLSGYLACAASGGDETLREELRRCA